MKAPPQLSKGEPALSYNWSDWAQLKAWLKSWGVDTHRLVDTNDGERIPAKLAGEIADALESHLLELEKEERTRLRPHIRIWRNGGGFRQR